MIAGIVVGSVALVAIIGIIIYCLCCKKRKDAAISSTGSVEDNRFEMKGVTDGQYDKEFAQ